MKTLTLLCVLVTIAASCGCAVEKSATSSPQEFDLAGNWVHHDSDSDSLAVMIFEPDQTGGIVVFGGGTAIGMAFTYEKRDGTIHTTPKNELGIPGFDIAIHSEELHIEVGEGRLQFHRSDDPRYKEYADPLRLELREVRE